MERIADPLGNLADHLRGAGHIVMLAEIDPDGGEAGLVIDLGRRMLDGSPWRALAIRDGDLLRVLIPNVDTLGEEALDEALRRWLLEWNFRTEMVHGGVDVDDGEVRLGASLLSLDPADVEVVLVELEQALDGYLDSRDRLSALFTPMPQGDHLLN